MKTGLIIAIAVIAVLVIGGIYLFTTMGGNTGTGNGGSTGGTSGGTGSTGGSSGNTGTPQTYNINIQNFAFSPVSLTVKKGDTVIWTNMDSTAHTVTSDSGSELGSGTLSNGKTYSHTFSTKGTYNYHCSIHTMMKATIIVQ